MTDRYRAGGEYSTRKWFSGLFFLCLPNADLFLQGLRKAIGEKPPLGSRRTPGLEDGRFGAHSQEMSEIPKFHSKMIKGGRWAVAITTGHGPVSYVGNFATEAEAQDWISTNAKDWPQPTDKPR